MGEAEVIPLGTRGRPGRGTGASPSAAARRLAGGRVPEQEPRSRGGREEPDAAEDKAAAEAAEPARTGAAPTDAASPEQPEQPDHSEQSDQPEQPGAAASPPGPDGPEASEEPGPGMDPGMDPEMDPEAGSRAAPGTEPAGEREPVTGEEREPGPGEGIPAADWLAALVGAAREVFGESWERRLAELLAMLRRRLTGEYVVDDYGFDAEITERFLLAAVRPLAEKWFRVEVRGAENIPADGGALLVSNHSGTIPMDGLVTMVAAHDHAGRHLRPLGADLVFRLPVVGEIARKAGATLACSEDAERMLRDGELVGVWPEGFKGIGKPYSERYKLQRFGRGGFVSAAMRTGVPIVPCSVVGAEEIYPLVGNLSTLARLVGLPYVPVTPFFPALGPLGLIPLPSKWLIEFGEPIRTDSYDAGAADDPMLVFNVTDQVRETIQQTLYSLLMQRRSVFH